MATITLFIVLYSRLSLSFLPWGGESWIFLQILAVEKHIPRLYFLAIVLTSVAMRFSIPAFKPLLFRGRFYGGHEKCAPPVPPILAQSP